MHGEDVSLLRDNFPRLSPADTIVSASNTTRTTMHSLPAELLRLILSCLVRGSFNEKQDVLRARLVCKAFDFALQPYGLKTFKLGVWHLVNGNRPARDLEVLPYIGQVCQALDIDMTLVRDEVELIRLNSVFRGIHTKVPEASRLLDTVQSYTMSQETFDETNFRPALAQILECIPNMTRMKFSLPQSVIGSSSRAATLLLATTFDCLAKRSEECKPLEILVLEQPSDKTIIEICKNPIDLRNAIATISSLKTLIVTHKRREEHPAQLLQFSQHLWFLVRRATHLENLCFSGWRKRELVGRVDAVGGMLAYWREQSLPYYSYPASPLASLRTLDLRRVNIFPQYFLSLIKDHAASLREIYLTDVSLKIFANIVDSAIYSWVGSDNISSSHTVCLIAESLHALPTLNLEILRATGLGYDVFMTESTSIIERVDASTWRSYDLDDPLGLGKSLDERFVEAVMSPNDDGDDVVDDGDNNSNLQSPPVSSSCDPSSSLPLSSVPTTAPISAASITHFSSITSVSASHPPHPPRPPQPPLQSRSQPLPPSCYDTATYQSLHRTAIHYRESIDDFFSSRNTKSLREMHRLKSVTEECMAYLTCEITRQRNLRVENGMLVDGEGEGEGESESEHEGVERRGFEEEDEGG